MEIGKNIEEVVSESVNGISNKIFNIVHPRDDKGYIRLIDEIIYTHLGIGIRNRVPSSGDMSNI